MVQGAHRRQPGHGMTPNQPANPPQTRSETCDECGHTFTPHRDWSRFCSDSCRSAHWRRTHEKINPPSVATVAGSGFPEQLSAASLAQKKTKINRILAELARGGSLHRFQAERLGDHCLHSTISRIEGYGIAVAREWIAVPGYAGHETRVLRYWLTNENKDLARVLLGWAAWPARY